MFRKFLASHQHTITARTRELLLERAGPTALPDAVDHSVPLFLAQVSEAIMTETEARPFSSTAIGETATKHGGDLLARGFTLSQVVYAYGDICQVVTAIAIEENVPISAEEFRILNRCLDTAIAGAVTEHSRRTADSQSTEEVERLGRLIHEVRGLLNTALMAYQMLKRGDVAINGSTGAVLGRSLAALSTLIENTVSDMRMTASEQRIERLPLGDFLADIAVAGGLDAATRGLGFTYELPKTPLLVNADPQLLASAVNNLLSNAFKYTHAGSAVVMRVRDEDSVVAIEIEDRCGGFPESIGDPFRAFRDRRATDRTGLGLGLSIARRSVRAGGGDVRIRNMPGTGCIFVIELPLAAPLSGSASASLSMPTHESAAVRATTSG